MGKNTVKTDLIVEHVTSTPVVASSRLRARESLRDILYRYLEIAVDDKERILGVSELGELYGNKDLTKSDQASLESASQLIDMILECLPVAGIPRDSRKKELENRARSWAAI